MPCIVIKAKKTDIQADISGLARELSEKTGINMERINIIVDYFDISEAFIGSNKDQLIITLWISETNEQSYKDFGTNNSCIGRKVFWKRGKQLRL